MAEGHGSCGSCAYRVDPAAGEQSPTCHRNPPDVVAAVNPKGALVVISRWPMVDLDGWCGERKSDLAAG